MKRAVIFLGLLFAATSVMAQGHRHHHHNHRHNNNYNWVAPAVIGGAIGYYLYRNNQETYVQPPVVYERVIPQYVRPVQQCGPWITNYNYDGTVTRSRTCSPNTYGNYYNRIQ